MYKVIGGTLILVGWYCFYIFNTPPKVKSEDTDVGILSRLINAEAGPNDLRDAYLVGSTVLNRAERQDFSYVVTEVVYQESQFGGVNSDKFVRTEHSDTVAVRLLKGLGRNCYVLYFYNPRHITDAEFKRKMDQHKLITYTSGHKFFGI